MSDVVGVDEPVVQEVARALGRVKREAGEMAQGVYRLVVQAGDLAPPGMRLASRQLGAFARWAQQAEADLSRRLGYLHPVIPVPGLFPSDGPFRSTNEAHRAGLRDGEEVQQAIRDYQAGRITLADLKSKTVGLRDRIVDPNYSAALFAEIDPALLGSLAFNEAGYDKNGDGVLNSHEARLFSADFGSLFEAFSTAESNGALPPGYRDKVLGLPAAHLGAWIATRGLSATFLYEAARRVLIVQPDERPPSARTQLQTLSAVAANLVASRMFLTDPFLLKCGLTLAATGALDDPALADRADAAMAAMIRGGLHGAAGTPAETQAAWGSVVSVLNAFPKLVDEPYARPRAVTYALAECFEPYLASLAFEGVDSEVREDLRIPDVGGPRIGLARQQVVTFLSHLMTDQRTRELLIGQIGAYAANLRLGDFFTLKTGNPQYTAAIENGFIERSALLGSAVTLIAEAADKTYRDARERAEFRAELVKSIAQGIISLIPVPGAELLVNAGRKVTAKMLESGFNGATDQLAKGALDDIKKHMEKGLPEDGTAVLKQLADTISNYYVSRFDTSGISEEQASDARRAFSSLIHGALFQAYVASRKRR